MTKENFTMKEDFCPACVVGAASIATGAVAAASAKDPKDKKKKVNELFRLSAGGLVMSGISLIIFYRYFSTCKECNAPAIAR